MDKAPFANQLSGPYESSSPVEVKRGSRKSVRRAKRHHLGNLAIAGSLSLRQTCGTT
jgi:hypothetical protein